MKMIRCFLNVWLVVTLVLVVLPGCFPDDAIKTNGFRPCFTALHDLIQRCSNRNRLYTTISLNTGSGFGSEFNFFFLKSALMATLQNRRFVYFISHRNWEYDCLDKLGWGCYLSFPSCPDSMIEVKDMDFSDRPSEDHLLEPGSTFFDQDDVWMLNPWFVEETFRANIERLKVIYKNKLPNGVCDTIGTDHIIAFDVAGIITKPLFHWNNKTQSAVNVLNKRYQKITSRPYISLFLRMTDKISETPSDVWALISNSTFVAHRVMEAMHNHTTKHNLAPIKNIFTATDNCSAAGEILNVLRPLGFRMYGACFHSNGSSVIEEKVKSQWNPRHVVDTAKVESNTHFFISELEMLRKASMFIGTIHSNVARMIHFARYPKYEDTYTITPHIQDEGIENLKYYFRRH